MSIAPELLSDEDRFVGEASFAAWDLPEFPPDVFADVDVDAIRVAETQPMTALTMARLGGIEAGSVSDADVVGLMAGWARVRAHADAQIASAILELRGRAASNEFLDADDLVAAEVAAALRLGSGGAERLVRTATDLGGRFRATLAAVLAGDVSWQKAQALVEQAAPLDDEHAARVEERVLPKAAARTPAQHADAVRRAVERIDPEAARARRERARREIELARRHLGDGMAELFARLTSEQVDTIWLGADAWTRRRKARGDDRTLGQLRVAALVQWAQSFLDPGHHPDNDPEVRPPTRHGRAVRLRVIWDVASFLGLTDRCGELADSGATVPADAIRELIAGGATVRRLLVDAATGELVDVTTTECVLPPTDGAGPGRQIELLLVMTTDELCALLDDRSTDDLSGRVRATDADLRAVLLAPVTAGDLDATPAAYPVPARLAEFIAIRDRHPTNPGSGLSPAGAGDLDHVLSVRDGGTTVRANLASPSRRWHLLKTHGGWHVRTLPHGWLWTSWTGRTTTVEPHDYRLGP